MLYYRRNKLIKNQVIMPRDIRDFFKGECKSYCLETDEKNNKSDEIIRGQLPETKRKISYPYRYRLEIFEKLNNTNISELQSDFDKWSKCISYKTNRRIVYGKYNHTQLGKQFIFGYNNDTRRSVFFYELKSINQNEYLEETIKIKKGVDEKNMIIEEYNEKVRNVIEKIRDIEKWDDYIEFEGKKYGSNNKFKNNIHIENNCLGYMVFRRNETEIRDRPFCNGYRDSDYSIYQCSKCKVENKQINGTNDEINRYYIAKGSFRK